MLNIAKSTFIGVRATDVMNTVHLILHKVNIGNSYTTCSGETNQKAQIEHTGSALQMSKALCQDLLNVSLKCVSARASAH